MQRPRRPSQPRRFRLARSPWPRGCRDDGRPPGSHWFSTRRAVDARVAREHAAKSHEACSLAPVAWTTSGESWRHRATKPARPWASSRVIVLPPARAPGESRSRRAIPRIVVMRLSRPSIGSGLHAACHVLHVRWDLARGHGPAAPAGAMLSRTRSPPIPEVTTPADTKGRTDCSLTRSATPGRVQPAAADLHRHTPRRRPAGVSPWRSCSARTIGPLPAGNWTLGHARMKSIQVSSNGSVPITPRSSPIRCQRRTYGFSTSTGASASRGIAFKARANWKTW